VINIEIINTFDPDRWIQQMNEIVSKRMLDPDLVARIDKKRAEIAVTMEEVRIAQEYRMATSRSWTEAVSRKLKEREEARRIACQDQFDDEDLL
jgi:hypothetical protein